MSVVQDVFNIPDDIATGLATGLYKRYGGIIRWATGPQRGQIVTHLKPVDTDVMQKAQSLNSRVIKFLKQNKNETIIALAGVTVIGASVATYKKLKAKEPKGVLEYKQALKVYIDAIREGRLTLEIIDNLINAIEEIKQSKNYEKICIELSAEDLEVVVGRINEYTLKLANDNNFDIDIYEGVIEENEPAIIYLQRNLKTQKSIFENAA